MSVAIYPNLCHLAVPQMLLLCILPFGTRQPELNIWDKNVSTQIIFFLKIFQLFPKNRNYPFIIAVAPVTNWCCPMLWYLVSALSNPDHGCPVGQNKVFKTIFKRTETSTQDILVIGTLLWIYPNPRALPMIFSFCKRAISGHSSQCLVKSSWLSQKCYLAKTFIDTKRRPIELKVNMSELHFGWCFKGYPTPIYRQIYKDGTYLGMYLNIPNTVKRRIHTVPAQKSNIIKKMSVGKSLTFSFIMIIRRLLLFARLSYYFTEVWCRTGEK